MPHYKSLLDPGIYLGPQDFPKEKTVTISRVVREKMPPRDGEDEEWSPIIYFAHKGIELPRKYKCPKSVLHGLSLVFGTDIDVWRGQTVTLFAAKCLAFGEIEDCIRVRFSSAIDSKIRKWMKKRGTSPKAYMVDPMPEDEQREPIVEPAPREDTEAVVITGADEGSGGVG
jgi:hypothetical protein